MRRRQIFAAQTAAREAALLTVGTPVKFNDPQIVRAEYVGEPVTFNPNACPKCGKVVTRGKFMHTKHCKGVAT